MENFKCNNCGCNEYTIAEGYTTKDGEVIKEFIDYSCDRCFKIIRVDKKTINLLKV